MDTSVGYDIPECYGIFECVFIVLPPAIGGGGTVFMDSQSVRAFLFT